jgi:hypothetical protein
MVVGTLLTSGSVVRRSTHTLLETARPRTEEGGAPRQRERRLAELINININILPFWRSYRKNWALQVSQQ